jgi:hypothetical protein
MDVLQQAGKNVAGYNGGRKGRILSSAEDGTQSGRLLLRTALEGFLGAGQACGNLAKIDKSGPTGADTDVGIHTEGAPKHSSSFFQVNPIFRRVYRRGDWVFVFTWVVKSMESHHLDEPHTPRGGHGRLGEMH